MKLGAGTVAAKKYGAAEFVDPRPYTVGKLSETFEIYPEIGVLLPAMGYSDQQLKDLETTINNTECDSVVIGTPIDLNRICQDQKTEYTGFIMICRKLAYPNLEGIIDDFVEKHNLKK